MYKPDSLRAALVAAVPDLTKDPERLVIFIDQGSIGVRPTNLSFEYSYILEVAALEYTHHPDLLFIAIIKWLQTHQPDILQSNLPATKGITFECEVLSNSAIDISIKLPLTENVQVRDVNGTRTITHLAEPPAHYCDAPEPGTWEFHVAGQHIGTLTQPADGSAPTYVATGNQPGVRP